MTNKSEMIWKHHRVIINKQLIPPEIYYILHIDADVWFYSASYYVCVK